MNDISEPHDLVSFMAQMRAEIQDEYERVRRNARSDPGTAGDQGEENWADVLKGWLPANYHVELKGRIIGIDGRLSPQVDLVVLKPTYPPKLLKKKVYLAAGVACAFECKLTLKAHHIGEAVRTASFIKSLYSQRYGSPVTELHSPMVYGLLSHSHSWKAEGSRPSEKITGALLDADTATTIHPRSCLDLVCVADLALWSHAIRVHHAPLGVTDIWQALAVQYGLEGCTLTSYLSRGAPSEGAPHGGNAVGLFVSSLLGKMAREDPQCKELSNYYQGVLRAGGEFGGERVWPNSVFSEQIRMKIANQAINVDVEKFLEWNGLFM